MEGYRQSLRDGFKIKLRPVLTEMEVHVQPCNEYLRDMRILIRQWISTRPKVVGGWIFPSFRARKARRDVPITPYPAPIRVNILMDDAIIKYDRIDGGRVWSWDVLRSGIPGKHEAYSVRSTFESRFVEVW